MVNTKYAQQGVVHERATSPLWARFTLCEDDDMTFRAQDIRPLYDGHLYRTTCLRCLVIAWRQ